MMRRFLIRFQLVFVSLLLLGTFFMVMRVLLHYNRRWDLTSEKLYSLSGTTSTLLDKMRDGKIDVIAFYPSNDNHRDDFEVFLKACQMRHHQFTYEFFDPDKRPQLAKDWKVREIFTVVVQYQQRQERLIMPNEESFVNALLRLLKPGKIPVCFLDEDDKREVSQDPESFGTFRQILDENNYPSIVVPLSQKSIPDGCRVVIVPGPQTDWGMENLRPVENAFYRGAGVFFMVDPMEVGTGKSYTDFMKDFGVELGNDVIIDKMSRMVGGDFLAPFVERYSQTHPATARFSQATFFPVARSLYPSAARAKPNLKVTSIAFSGSNSWSENDLASLAKGDAVFEPTTDSPGPNSLAVVIEEEKSKAGLKLTGPADDSQGGRMAVVGDSDFLTNGYVQLSGNREFGLALMRWLARDDRFIALEAPRPNFVPLVLNEFDRGVMMAVSMVGIPLFFLVIGTIQSFLRRRMA